MVKIDFENVSYWADLGHTVQVVKNIRKDLAESMYNHGVGFGYLPLSVKIYNSKGETEYSDEEYGLIMAFAKQIGTPADIDALEAYGKNNQ